MRTKLIKVHTVKSHLIVQFDKFNGHASVAISCGYSLVNKHTSNEKYEKKLNKLANTTSLFQHFG